MVKNTKKQPVFYAYLFSGGRYGILIIFLAFLFFIRNASADLETNPRIWKITDASHMTWRHQYYTIDDFNADGSKVVLLADNSWKQAFIVDRLDHPVPVELALFDENGLKKRHHHSHYFIWHATDRDLLYYRVTNDSAAAIVEHNVRTGAKKIISPMFDAAYRLAAAHPAGRYLLLWPFDAPFLNAKIFDLATGKFLDREIETHGENVDKAWWASMNSDDLTIATLSGGALFRKALIDTTQMIDISPDIFSEAGCKTTWTHTATTLDGSMVAMMNICYRQEFCVRIYDREKENQDQTACSDNLFHLGTHKNGGHIIFSPDNTLALVSCHLQNPENEDDGYIVVYDLTSSPPGRIVARFEHRNVYAKHLWRMVCARFSPDMTKIIFNSSDGVDVMEAMHTYVYKFKSPDNVRNVTAEKKGKHLMLSWDPPRRMKEVASYVIYLDGQQIGSTSGKKEMAITLPAPVSQGPHEITIKTKENWGWMSDGVSLPL